MTDKIYTCGSRPCDQDTTLEDIQQTVQVLKYHAGWSSYHSIVGFEYSQAISSLEFTLRGVKPVERDDYVTRTDTKDFNVDQWKVAFKYNLWDAIVTYAHRGTRQDGMIATSLMDTRLRLDRRLSEEQGKRMLRFDFERGWLFTWKEYLQWGWAKVKKHVRWDIINKIPFRYRSKFKFLS